MAASSPTPATELELTAESNPTGTVFYCRGRITAASTPRLQAEVRKHFAGGKRVVLDLSDVKYVDSAGLGAIVQLWTSARKAECEFKVSNLTSRVRELFALTNIASIFEGVEHNGK